jgi:hypothetical protein
MSTIEKGQQNGSFGSTRSGDGRWTRVKIFRRHDDLRQLVEHQRRIRALGTVVAPDHTPALPSPVEPELAPVISLAALRARRAGHPSGGARSSAPVTVRN